VNELYFESGYLEASYFGTLAVASSGVSFTAGLNVQGDIASTTGYYIPDYIQVDYFFAFVSASAAITSSFASVSAVNKTVSANAEFTATFLQTATISHIEGADLFAFNNAAIAVQVSRIRNNNITVSAVFSIAVDASRIRSSAGDDLAQFSFTANTVLARSRDYASSQSAAFSLAVDAVKTARASSSLSSQFTQIALANFTALAQGVLTTTTAIFTSKYLGSDRPREIFSASGFDNRLLGFAQRSTYLANLRNVTSWYYESQIQIQATSGTIPAFENVTILDMPFTGSSGDVGLKVVLRFFPSTATLQITTFVLNNITTTNVVGNGQNVLAGFLIAVQYHNEAVSLYIDGVRVNQFAQAASAFTPYTAGPLLVKFGKAGTQPSTYRLTTDFAWLALGNYSNGGSAAYQGYTNPLVNTEDTRFFYEFNGNGQETINLALTASASIVSTGTVNAVVGRRTQFQSALVSTAQLTAIGGELKDINLVAFDDIEVTANAQRLRGNQIDINAAGSFSATANRIRSTSVDVVSQSSISVAANRLRSNFLISLNIFALCVTAGIKVKFAASNFSSQFITTNFYYQDDYIQSGYYEQVETTAVKTASSTAALVVVSAFTASARTDVGAALVAQSSTNVTATVKKTVSVQIVNASVFAQAAVVSRIRSTTATFTVNTAVTAQGLKGGEIFLQAFTNASISLFSTVNRPASAGLNITAVFVANTEDSLNIGGNSNVNVVSTFTASARKFAGAQAQIQAAGFVISVSVAQRTFLAQFSTVSTLTVSTVIVARATATIVSVGSVSAVIGVRRLATANITSALTFVVAVRELRLDAIVYVIPAEGWTYRIEGETRLHTILSESRVKEIVGESRLHTINGESRIHII